MEDPMDAQPAASVVAPAVATSTTEPTDPVSDSGAVVPSPFVSNTVDALSAAAEQVAPAFAALTDPATTAAAAAGVAHPDAATGSFVGSDGGGGGAAAGPAPAGNGMLATGAGSAAGFLPAQHPSRKAEKEKVLTLEQAAEFNKRLPRGVRYEPVLPEPPKEEPLPAKRNRKPAKYTDDDQKIPEETRAGSGKGAKRKGRGSDDDMFGASSRRSASHPKRVATTPGAGSVGTPRSAPRAGGLSAGAGVALGNLAVMGPGTVGGAAVGGGRGRGARASAAGVPGVPGMAAVPAVDTAALSGMMSASAMELLLDAAGDAAAAAVAAAGGDITQQNYARQRARLQAQMAALDRAAAMQAAPTPGVALPPQRFASPLPVDGMQGGGAMAVQAFPPPVSASAPVPAPVPLPVHGEDGSAAAGVAASEAPAAAGAPQYAHSMAPPAYAAGYGPAPQAFYAQPAAVTPRRAAAAPVRRAAPGGRSRSRKRSDSDSDSEPYRSSPERQRRATRAQPVRSTGRVRVSEAMQPAYQIVQMLLKKENAVWFSRPVDPVADQAFGYYDIIKHPMDLGTIKQRIESGYYDSDVSAFRSDVDLVWSNACTYNRPDHVVHQTALKLRAEFYRLLRAYMPHAMGPGSTPAAAAAAAAAGPGPEAGATPEERGRGRHAAPPSAPPSEYSAMAPPPSTLQTPAAPLDNTASEKLREMNEQMALMQRKLEKLEREKQQRSAGRGAAPAAQPKKAAPRRRVQYSDSESEAGAAGKYPDDDSDVDISGTSGPAPSLLLDRPMTYDEKKQLSNDINRLPGDKVGRVVEIIQEGLPSDQNNDKDDIEIDIDILDTQTLRRLEQYVRSCLHPPPAATQPRPAPARKPGAGAAAATGAGAAGRKPGPSASTTPAPLVGSAQQRVQAIEQRLQEMSKAAPAAAATAPSGAGATPAPAAAGAGSGPAPTPSVATPGASATGSAPAAAADRGADSASDSEDDAGTAAPLQLQILPTSPAKKDVPVVTPAWTAIDSGAGAGAGGAPAATGPPDGSGQAAAGASGTAAETSAGAGAAGAAAGNLAAAAAAPAAAATSPGRSADQLWSSFQVISEHQRQREREIFEQEQRRKREREQREAEARAAEERRQRELAEQQAEQERKREEERAAERAKREAALREAAASVGTAADMGALLMATPARPPGGGLSLEKLQKLRSGLTGAAGDASAASGGSASPAPTTPATTATPAVEDSMQS